ncbi:isg15 ubiquitin-like modifier [Stygiomarasmius scandens]|uniref:Isg15 ubiquitin-like modifier n=1 Tax=Marasmiellus scandens TaxID=2682957 RepID=A0ABR1JLC4_9AGAR
MVRVSFQYQNDLVYESDFPDDILVRALKEEVEEWLGLPVDRQKIMLSNAERTLLQDDKSIQSYGIVGAHLQHDLLLEEEVLAVEGDRGYMMYGADSEESGQEDLDHGMNIFIKNLLGLVARFKVDRDTSLQSVIEEAQKRKDLPPGTHRLVYRGQQLDVMRTVGYYNIENKSILFAVPALRGGGIRHRGLAYAIVQCEWDGEMYSSNVSGLRLSSGKAVTITGCPAGGWFWGRHPGEHVKSSVFPSDFVQILDFTDSTFKSHMESNIKECFEPLNDASGQSIPQEPSLVKNLLQKHKFTPKPTSNIPTFPYKTPERKDFKFGFADKGTSFIYISVKCDPVVPGSPMNVRVDVNCHAHDTSCVTSIHLAVKVRGCKVSAVRPENETLSGNNNEMDVRSVTNAENTLHWTVGTGIEQIAKVEGEIGEDKKISKSVELGGKEIIPSEIHGQIVQGDAFWNIKSEITPSRIRGFSGPVWTGTRMEFTVDACPTVIAYTCSVGIQGKTKPVEGSKGPGLLKWLVCSSPERKSSRGREQDDGIYMMSGALRGDLEEGPGTERIEELDDRLVYDARDEQEAKTVLNSKCFPFSFCFGKRLKK